MGGSRYLIRPQKNPWFKFGSHCQHKIATQLSLANCLIGEMGLSNFPYNDPGVIPKFALKRRKQSYAHFFKESVREHTPFMDHNIPLVIRITVQLQPDVKTTLPENLEKCDIQRQTFHPEYLDGIKEDMQLLVVSSNKISKLEVRDGSLKASCSLQKARLTTTCLSRDLEPGVKAGNHSNFDSVYCKYQYVCS